MYSDGYMKNWIGKTINNPQSKQRYIENSILKYINIDENCKIDIWINEAPTLSFSKNIETNKSTKIQKGVSKRLFNEKGKYYLSLDNLNNYNYTVKMKIYL